MPRKRLSDYEQELKWIALVLGLVSTIAAVQDWYPYTMFIGLPFCIIWIYCAWLHTEKQLKWINIMFAVVYVYGIVRYLVTL